MSNFTGNAEFFSHVEKIDSLNVEIHDKEKEIEEIKAYSTNDDQTPTPTISTEEIIQDNLEESTQNQDEDKPSK